MRVFVEHNHIGVSVDVEAEIADRTTIGAYACTQALNDFTNAHTYVGRIFEVHFPDREVMLFASIAFGKWQQLDRDFQLPFTLIGDDE